jgi:ATP-dependent RNA helicase DDX23/PRP28
MFSATFPPEVQKLAKRFMTAPATVQIGDQDSGKNKRIEQEITRNLDELLARPG